MAQQTKKRFLALGDSYTIGESVEASGRWPHQLTTQMEKEGVIFNTPEIIAVTGWTTHELIEGIQNSDAKGPYDMVSLLIGVNNQYRGYHIEIYKNEFAELLFTAAKFAGNDFSKVFVVSIPDYGVTPFAQSKDPQKISKEIDLYNKIAREIAEENGVKFFDITPVSKTAKGIDTLTAEDGLHPSSDMYSLWVDVLWKDLVSRYK